MLLSAPILPPDEPCSEILINPRNAMVSLRSLTRLLPINGSLRNLSSTLGISEPISLREALLQGTWCAIQPKAIEPPAELIFPGQEERLVPYLRAFAQGKDPRKTLIQAAVECCCGNILIATALADLAVTGRTSYETFAKSPLTDTMLVPDVKASLPTTSDAQITLALTTVLDRAYNVAFALRGPYPERAALRCSLGWIAVSGEDDPPHRPVNVVSAPYPQYEIPVVVGGVTVQTRFFIASPPLPANEMTTTTFPTPGRSLPKDVAPLVPDGDRVILFIHGHSSRAEEALELIPWLHQAGLEKGVRFSVISLDLPNNGYSSMFDHEDVAPSSATVFTASPLEVWPWEDKPIRTPILDFIEKFIVAFVDKLDSYTQIKDRFAGVIGGSLGGNMGLRLGRHNYSWLANGIVSWSPASVWPPMVEDAEKGPAPLHCCDKWGENENDAFSRFAYFQEVFEGKIFGSGGNRESLGEVVTNIVLGRTQPEMWYRDGWPCKVNHIVAERRQRHEIYNQWFRRWHWRVAGEQLIYSHWDREDRSDAKSDYRYMSNQVRLLLAVGFMDNYDYTEIRDQTIALAEKMDKTPGRLLLFMNTGHSIHAERPHCLADEIVRFFMENW